MSVVAGLVGFPNVGKSTLFNALTKSAVPAENYPFCTIEPHTATALVKDPRIEKLKSIYNPAKIVPPYVQFVDIAGLVKGASSGEGLGNKFLGSIREVDLILHVLRCFEDSEITHVLEKLDPISDYEIIITELILKDLESVAKRLSKIESLRKQARGGPAAALKGIESEKKLLDRLEQALNEGNLGKIRALLDGEVSTVSLLSGKKFLILANLSDQAVCEGSYKDSECYKSLKEEFGNLVIPFSAKLEYELSQMDDSESKEFAGSIGMQERGVDRIILEAFKNLDLISFFTCGPKEVHAWPVKRGISIRKAAGKIHSDLERGFICAEVYHYDDILEWGTEAKLKDLGKIRTEGQNYIVKDGDIINIKFNI